MNFIGDGARQVAEKAKQDVGVNQSYATIPKELSFTATAASAANVDEVGILDPSGATADLGIQSANLREFSMDGNITLSTLKNVLQSYALFIGSFNYKSTVNAQVNQSIDLVSTSLDGSNRRSIIPTGKRERNTQFQDGLYTIPGDSFIMTNLTSVLISTTADDRDVTIVAWDITPIPYSMLIHCETNDQGITAFKGRD